MNPPTDAAVREWLSGYVSRPLSDSLVARLQQYLSLLLRWNARVNLTAVRDPEGIVRRHFGESLFVAEHLPYVPSQPQNLLDHGSGAGFPGLVIAMARPEIAVTLSESQARKAAFLREAVRTLDVKNAEVWAARTETLSSEFAWVTARAVDDASTAVSTAWSRVVPGGFLVTSSRVLVETQVEQTEWVTGNTRLLIAGPKR